MLILIILDLRITLSLLRAAAGRRAGREENGHVKWHSDVVEVHVRKRREELQHVADSG